MRNVKSLTIAAISLSFVFTNCSKEYDLPIETPIPTTERAAEAPKPTGEFMVSPAGYRNAFKGFLITYDKAGNTIKEITTGSTTMDFKKWVYKDGTVRYSYLNYDKNVVHMLNVGYNAGQIVVLDKDFKEINRIVLLPYMNRTVADNNALDGHDFILLSDTHYIAMAYFETKVNNIPASLSPIRDCKVVAPIIQEVENGQVIWEWDGTNEPELYTTSVEGNDFTTGALTQDYAHLNSMYIDPKDNNIVASFRNLNQVLKLERKTGNILWRLGGKNSDFLMTAEQKFLRQHNAHFLADGKTLILFDNGDLKERPATRIVEFTLDEKNKKITKYKSMYLPDRSFSQYMGSVMKTDSSYFIGGGSQPRVLEVDLETGQTIFEKTLDLPSYRVYRY